MKIEIKKSEVDVIKQALQLYSTLIKENKYVGHDYYWGDLELIIEDDKLSLPYKISLLRKLAEIEYRIVEKQVDYGFLKKRSGNLHCWWKWTTTDKNWKKTKFGKKVLKPRIGK